MANEIHVIGPSTATCYVHILNSSGQRWNGSAFEAFSAANYANYDVTVAEDSTTGIFIGTMPSTVPAGRHDIILFRQLGGSPADGDRAVGAQALQWSGSATAPATTPLGSLTGSELKDYIVSAGWKRTDMDDELYDALTDTVLEMEQSFRFDERETESVMTDTITVLGDYKMNLQSDFGQIVSIVLIDGNFSHRLTKISKEAYDLLYPSPATEDDLAYPEHFALYGGQVYIGPAPDKVTYQYRKAYSQRLTATIDANTDPVPFSAKYREVLKDGTLRRLFQNVKNWETSDRFLGYFTQGLERAKSLERGNRGGANNVLYNDF